MITAFQIKDRLINTSIMEQQVLFRGKLSLYLNYAHSG